MARAKTEAHKLAAETAVGRAAGKTVVLAVSGSIAAYKAVEVARQLVASGARVLPVMTTSAAHFVGPLTLSGITGAKVLTDMFDPAFPGEVHVALGSTADLLLIVPATADLLARLACGRADDLLTALALSAKCPVLAAPAMHTRMWTHPATQRNVETLARDGRVALVGPVDGPLASGEVGMGRLAPPEDIVEAALRSLGSGAAGSAGISGLSASATQDLAGVRVVVTAGPTAEDVDPVRFLSNRSTGKMGFAVAERARSRGAAVTLIAGPVALPTPAGVDRVDVRGALAMRAALAKALGRTQDKADVLVMTAAVADYRPRVTESSKVKKSGERTVLELVKNPDLLAEIGQRRASLSKKHPVLVGFALETGADDAIVQYAQGKLRNKRVDVVVANHAEDGFAGDTNRATLVSRGAVVPLQPMSKLALADIILDDARARLGVRTGGGPKKARRKAEAS